MASVKKSVLVPYSAERMYALVENIHAYPEFIPWCGAAQMLAREGEFSTVRLLIDYRGVRQHFTTRNEHDEGESITIALVDGPFRRLDGRWVFLPLLPDASKVELELSYEFRSGALEKLVGPVFAHIATTFVEAFTRRAEQLYGSG